jgi:thioredoxin reductase
MNTSLQTNGFDAVVVGGSVAGLSAALLLGRACKRVLVCDSGKPRNQIAHASHNYFSRDGIAPAELLQIGREQLQPYDVEIRQGEVINAENLGDYPSGTLRERFQVTLSNGDQFLGRRLLLATGMKDTLPSIEGFAELWGNSVFHCPYCHGWEVRDQPLAIYGKGDAAFEQAFMLTGWSRDLVLCSDGAAELSDEQRQQLLHWGIQIREEKIARLDHQAGKLTGLVFANHETLPRRGILLSPQSHQHSDLATKLGCKLDSNNLVEVNDFKQTSVTGVYAVGDASSPLSQISWASASGMIAASFVNRSLIEENLVNSTLS